MNTNKAYNNYLKNEIEGASQGKLIVMMYDAAIRFMRQSIKSINEKKIEDAHNNLIRAESIVYELMTTLNLEEGGEVAQNLLNLYDFVVWQLIEANNSKNASKIEEVIKLITPIRDAWREVVAKENPPAPQQNEQKQESKPINFAG